MREFEVNWEGLIFTIDGEYEPEDKETYFEPYSRDRIKIYGIYLGDACVDFMLNKETTEILEKEILNSYYR